MAMVGGIEGSKETGEKILDLIGFSENYEEILKNQQRLLVSDKVTEMHEEEFRRFEKQLPVIIRNELDSDYGFQRRWLYQQYLNEKLRLEMGSLKSKQQRGQDANQTKAKNEQSEDDSFDPLEYADMDDLGAYKTRVKSQVRKLKRDKKFEQAFSFQKVVQLKDKSLIDMDDNKVMDVDSGHNSTKAIQSKAYHQFRQESMREKLKGKFKLMIN